MEATRLENNGSDDEDNPFAVFDVPASLKGSLTSLTAPSLVTFSAQETLSGRISLPSCRASGDDCGVSATETLGKAGPITPASIMHVVSASSQSDLLNDNMKVQQGTKATVVKEPNSGINVSHPTKSCEQLPLVLAQFPFSTFMNVRRSFTAVGVSAPSLTAIGVVIRKTDPKQKGGKYTYSVVSLWNMRGPFPTPAEELSILFGGSAFDVHYTKLVNGVVLALSGIQPIEGYSRPLSTNTSLSNAHNTHMGADSSRNVSNNSQLLRIVKSEQVRVLGYAADLSTCQGTQQRSGEHCNNIVNGAISKFCLHHISGLRREARGDCLLSTSAKLQTPSGASHSAKTTSAGVTRINISAHRPIAAMASKSTPQRLLRQQVGFLTVKGSCGLPTTTPASSDATSAGGVYAGVRAGDTLPVTGMCRNVGHVYKSLGSLGVTARGRAVLAAAVDQEDAKEHQRLIKLALKPNEGGKKRSREDELSCMTAATKSAQEVETVRAQYAPLKSSHASTSFAPMRCSGFDEVSLRREDYQHQIITKRTNGTMSAIVSTVERRLRGNNVFSKAAAHAKGESHQNQPHDGVGACAPASLLSAVAASMQSVNDDMRTDDERRRFEQRTQRRLMQDKALDALSKVTEQAVNGIYCRQCERWYMRRNERCKTLHHSLEARETTRHFIECEHCGYKTSILGDVRPSKMIPRCPRCCADVMWRVSNAAPEIAAPKEIAPQL